MARSLTPGNAMLGFDVRAHMSFLVHAPERVLALRLALSRVIRPTSVVLDAGCGALGLLAIMAAKLGAARVVGVDLGALDWAKALAEENGVSDRVQFIQGDLHDVDLPLKTFDVIVGMIYNNEPRLDFAQQRLMASLVGRFGNPETAIIPNKIRFTVAGYNNGVRDRSNWTSRVEWETCTQNVERQTGMTFAAVHRLVDQTGAAGLTTSRSRSARSHWLRRWIRRFRGVRRARLGHLDRSQRTLLTQRKLFTEINYTARTKEFGYPQSVSLPVMQRGQLNIVVFQRDMMFDDLLIRATESRSVVCMPQWVEPGDVVVLSTGEEWERCIPFTVERKPAPRDSLGRLPFVGRIRRVRP
jgi:SAM-dependent methyltransferase